MLQHFCNALLQGNLLTMAWCTLHLTAAHMLLPTAHHAAYLFITGLKSSCCCCCCTLLVLPQ
jgi:hypothetical protein